jgi:hypothetical protein
MRERLVPGPASNPRWLVIPKTGLFTGMAIVGAICTGKTTACMYPYVEQLRGCLQSVDVPNHE